jgi:hypothetical protein
MARQPLALAVALFALSVARAAAAGDPFEQMPVASDAELGELRGGFVFKVDGLELRMAIGLETRVGDQVLLRSEIGAEDLRHLGAGLGGDTSALHLGPRVVTAGDPNTTEVIHQIGAADLNALVRNRVDDVSIQNIGRMQIEVPNFSEHAAAMRQGLAAQNLSDMLGDAGAGALQR